MPPDAFVVDAPNSDHEWVAMYHPDLAGDDGLARVSTVTKQSFEDNHSEKGWKLVPSDAQLVRIDESTNGLKVSRAKPGAGSTGGDA